MNLDEQRREIERRQGGAETRVYVCERHGEHTTLVCHPCYGEQQKRVERESIEIRYANTTEAMRARAVAGLAGSNGHGH